MGCRPLDLFLGYGLFGARLTAFGVFHVGEAPFALCARSRHHPRRRATVFRPTTFGKYFLTKRIAIGGMAEVFAAKLYGADGFEKDLVIKQILPQYARDPVFVQSFVTEAKIAVSLNHANVVGIYELGRVDGTYFIAMELVDGLDCFSLIQTAKTATRRIDIGAALLITEEVAKGLDYAHRKVGPDGLPLGLVHRDLNPRNVLVSREGDVKILDFGIAKTSSAVTAMPKTRAGVVKGTTGYMSPEQATGRNVDARTDVYQAGLLLWELLTHQALFWRPDDQETRERMRRHHVAAPSTLEGSVPEAIDELVLAALERDPAHRIQTAADLARRIGVVRYTNYPGANPVDLGRLVTDLLEKKETKDEEMSEVLPSTMDLSDALDEVLASSGKHRIETIARAPSSVVRADPPRTPPATTPATQTPVDATTGTNTAEAETPIHLPPATALPSSSRSSVALAALLALGALGGVIWFGTQRSPKPSKLVAAPPPTVTATVAVSPPPPPAQPEPPPPPPAIETPPPRTPTKRAVVTPTGFGTVAFGTRSCSSRVSLDGVVVARSTPSFDHRVPAGPHTVVIEGTSCPPIERPGSLRRTIPTVRKRIVVAAGANLKIIADYERERMLVRRQ